MASNSGTPSTSSSTVQKNVNEIGSSVAPNKMDDDMILDIGRMFVEQYYTYLNSKIDQIHLFYHTNAKVLRGYEAQILKPLNGIKEIEANFKEFTHSNQPIEITNIDVQNSINSTILVQVIGKFNTKDEGSLKFVQTFILVDQQGHFVIINDVFRYLTRKVISQNSNTSTLNTQAISAPKFTQGQPIKPIPGKETPLKPEATGAEAKDTSKPEVKPTSVPQPTEPVKSASSGSSESKTAQPKTWATLVSSTGTPKWVPGTSGPTTSSAPATSTPSPALKPSPSTPNEKENYSLTFRIKETSTIKKAIHDAFSVFGTVKALDIKNGVVTLEFSSQEALNKALEKSKFVIGGENVTVEAKKSAPSHSRQNSTSGTGDKKPQSQGQTNNTNQVQPQRKGDGNQSFEKSKRGGASSHSGSQRGAQRGGRGGSELAK